MYCHFSAIQRSVRPVIGSAASFLFSTAIIHHFALWLDPSFSLLLTRGVGKAALVVAGIVQAACFVAIAPRSFFTPFWRDDVFWPLATTMWRPFSFFFALFASAHILFIGGYLWSGVATYHHHAWSLCLTRWPVLAIGALGTFLLAWSEELLFRGLLYRHFNQYLTVWPSALLSSAIFSILHDLRNPLSLVTTQWQLGLGLFLLGMMLTGIALRYGSLAASAGAHAGLVYIKVVLRKIPLITMVPTSQYLFPIDLRESLVAHILIASVAVLLLQSSHQKCIKASS